MMGMLTSESFARSDMVHLRPAVHRTILVVDVEGFGDRRRTNPHQVAVRDGVYGILQQAFRKADILWSRCRHEDRGDGVFMLAPAEVPKGLFVESLPLALVEALRQHNEMRPDRKSTRLNS